MLVLQRGSGEFTSLPPLVTKCRRTALGGQSFWTWTIRSDTKLLGDIVRIFEEDIVPLKSAASLQLVLTYEPISTSIIAHFASRGGNALGVAPADGSLIMSFSG